MYLFILIILFFTFVFTQHTLLLGAPTQSYPAAVSSRKSLLFALVYGKTTCVDVVMKNKMEVPWSRNYEAIQ